VENTEKAMRILLSILANPVVKEHCVEEWTHFDWAAARVKASNRQSTISKIFFSTNVALAGLVENPVSFYLQVRFFFTHKNQSKYDKKLFFLSPRPCLFAQSFHKCGLSAANQQPGKRTGRQPSFVSSNARPAISEV
jgi:hypothetical protein